MENTERQKLKARRPGTSTRRNGGGYSNRELEEPSTSRARKRRPSQDACGAPSKKYCPPEVPSPKKTANTPGKYSANERLKKLKGTLTPASATLQPESSPQKSFKGVESTIKKRPAPLESPLVKRLADIKNGSQATPKAKNLATEKLSKFKNEVKLGGGDEAIIEISSGSESDVKSPLAERLAKIRRKESDTDINPVEKCDKCYKMSSTRDWVVGHQCLAKDLDSSLSESLMVNVDDTVLNKTALNDSEDESMEIDGNLDCVNEVSEAITPEPAAAKQNLLCVVADTNIFLSFLNKIRDIIYSKTLAFKRVIVYVPWMVFSELDYQKDKASQPLRGNAMNAIRFIEQCLREKNPKFVGQSVVEMGQQKDIGMSQDDKILSCTMQASEKYETVFLLSNDINLRNKATVCGLIACTPSEVLSKIKSTVMKTTKTQKISAKLGLMCSQVICECCKEAYGDACSKMNTLKNPPWSLIECLKRLRQYWGPVFRTKLLKQCLKTIEDFINVLTVNKDICDDSEEFDEFMKLSVALCVYLKDIAEVKLTVQNAIDEIVKLAS